jgi:hypothetical protein
MKTIIFALLLFFCVSLDAAWVDLYKKGSIKLIPDPGFAKNTDWSSIFFKWNERIAVAPDGKIFISEYGGDKIYVADKNGNFLKTFGQRGLGPGDLVGPRDISILDNKYLVVGESGEVSRRVSIFNLETRIVDIVNVRSFILQCVSLKNNKIAYVTQKEIGNFIHYLVCIADFRTKKTNNIAEFKWEKRKSDIQAGTYYPSVFIEQLNGGDLLVGYSDNTQINIYSPEGKKTRSFNVYLKRQKVTSAMKEEVMGMFEESVKKHPFLRQSIKRIDESEIFPEYIPFYREIKTDPDDNILVFKHKGFERIKDYEFQVYSKEGKYICDSKIDFCSFIPSPILRMCFVKEDLFFILEKECSDDICIDFIKVKIN